MGRQGDSHEGGVKWCKADKQIQGEHNAAIVKAHAQDFTSPPSRHRVTAPNTLRIKNLAFQRAAACSQGWPCRCTQALPKHSKPSQSLNPRS